MGAVLFWPLAALLLALAGWSVLLANLRQDRAAIEGNALREATAFANSHAEYLSRTVESIDQVTLHVRYAWQQSQGKLHLDALNAQGLFPPSSYSYLAITDRDGRIVTSTLPELRGLEIGDRGYFRLQREADTDSVFIGEPVYGRGTGRQVLHVSRRLLDERGGFAGVVLVAVTLSYFTATYDPVVMGSLGFLGMSSNDGQERTMRVGHRVSAPGERFLMQAPANALLGGTGLLEGRRWFADGRARYVAWQAVYGYPLIAFAGLDREEVLAPYQRNADASMYYATLASLALLAFATIATVLSLRLAWRKQQVTVLQTTYRLATEAGTEGFYIAHPVRAADGGIADFEVMDCNRRGAEFFGSRREEFIGIRLSSCHPGEQGVRFLHLLTQAWHEGRKEAELPLASRRGDEPRWIALQALRAEDNLAVTLRDITDAKAHVAELEQRSNHDALTGLPNRHWVGLHVPQSIAAAAHSGATLAFLFIDLDGFKTVNDSMGHEAGDQVLRVAAKRLRLAVRPQDHVVRLGGDEFVVILEGIGSKEDAAQVAQRILQSFEERFHVAGATHAIGTSIGISLYPQDGGDVDTLLKHADVAMYSVKTTGKRNYRFYDQKFYDALMASLRQESELRHAIDHDQFVLHYQPRVDISTGVTSSMEALVRWAHPLRGLVEPSEFIPIAEDTGLILPLGELIIDKVCAQLAFWARSGQELVPVSVNVSPRQFSEANMATVIRSAIERNGLEPSLIEIELTESSMLTDTDELTETIAAIRGMGVKLLVDDFGTGYSSLSQLQRLDVDVLKVDRAFTAELGKTEQGKVFFTAIVTMAHALGMRVVAEGVESEAQLRILKSLRCDEIQGYFVSRPLPPTDTQPILPKWFLPSAL
ncbi:bifunctional diguanylate cyclase/phosphodiesterase [Noviherbaspirillum humi]|nr:EAL domain-containing protein [Noviherbaspirillum humi]